MFVPRIARSKIGDLADFRKSKEYIAYVKKTVNTEFMKMKRRLIENFNSHPVTIEINAGPGSKNISNTLGGVGNLYSYIGFNKGSKPIQPILSLLERETAIASFVFSKNGTFKVFISNPTPQDIFNVTPLPWAQGRSWAEGIERGLSGFGFYLNKESSKSRSGIGLQTENKLRSGKFQNTSYITKLIRDFELQVKQLNRSKF